MSLPVGHCNSYYNKLDQNRTQDFKGNCVQNPQKQGHRRQTKPKMQSCSYKVHNNNNNNINVFIMVLNKCRMQSN